MHLQDHVLIFHESAGCPGLITSIEEGGRDVLRCAECGKLVGIVDGGVLAEIVSLIPTVASAPA